MPDLYSVALHEAREAEREAHQIAEAIERERNSGRVSLGDLLRRRDPLVLAFARASRRLIETARRMDAAWAESAAAWSRVTYL
jgi:hypothetical protein